jgi:hypothetical protein
LTGLIWFIQTVIQAFSPEATNLVGKLDLEITGRQWPVRGHGYC